LYEEEMKAKIASGQCDGPDGYTKCSGAANISMRLNQQCKDKAFTMDRSKFDDLIKNIERIPSLPELPDAIFHTDNGPIDVYFK
jgi:hypothetical protein